MGIDQEKLIDWDKVKSTFWDYLKDPVPENAKLFLDTLPKEKTNNETGDKAAATLYIYDNYLSFEAGVSGVLAGDRYLAEAAFRLLNFSDAGFSESLDQMLGNLARERPRLYLEFLLKHRNGSFIKDVGLPILETNSWEPEDMIAEWTKRVNALKTVKETKYRQIRDECIRLLEGAINQCLSENTWELIDWDKVRSTYMEYLKNPTLENGERLLEALPQEKTENQMGDVSGAMYSIYDSYPVLKPKVLGGDRCLTEAAFRLLNFSDGDFAETLNEILGNLATKNPKLFLEFLNKYKSSSYVIIVGYPVYGTGADGRERILSEWAKRVRALKTVKEAKYRQIRDECICLLEEAIKYPPEWLDYIKK